MGEKTNCINAHAVPKTPKISAPRALSPERSPTTSLGQTGMMMPSASMSSRTVMKMKTSAAWRGSPAGGSWSAGTSPMAPRLPQRRPGPAIFRRTMRAAAEPIGGMPTPAGIVEKAASQGHHIRLAIGNDGRGLIEAGDQADGARQNSRLRLDGGSQPDLVSWSARYARMGNGAARGYADVAEPEPSKFAGKDHRVLDAPPALDPIAARDAGAKRDAGRQ